MSRMRKSVPSRSDYAGWQMALAITIASALAVLMLVLSQGAKKSLGWGTQVPQSDLPQLPAVVIDPATGGPTDLSLILRAEFLFANHPDPEIRAIAALFKTMSVQIHLIDASQGAAMYFLAFHDGGVPPDLRSLIPVFRVDRKWIASVSLAQIRNAMLIITHECEHYKQWRRATTTAEKFFFAMNSGQEVARIVFEAMSVEQACTMWWKNESAAYLHQCHVLHEWGITDVIESLCERADTALWNSALFDHLNGRGPPPCQPTFARLADRELPE